MPADEPSSSDDKGLLHAIEGAERYRTRARSVATITATGAGALAAGLVLNSASNFSFFTKLSGLTSIVFLLLATVVFIIASLVHIRTAEAVKAGRLRTALRPWETVYSPEARSTNSAESRLRQQSNVVLTRLLKTMDVGMWMAGVAIFSLVAALISISFAEPPREKIKLSVSGVRPVYAACPELPMSFVATALKSDLDKDASRLLITVTGASCGTANNHPVSLYIDRQSFQIAIEK